MAETDKKAFGEVLSYKDAVMRRTSVLLCQAEVQEASINRFAEKVDSGKKHLKAEVSSLKQDVALLKKEVSEAKKVILQSIAQMKYSVKKDELAKIEKRSEAWNPEMLASRDDLRKFTSRQH